MATKKEIEITKAVEQRRRERGIIELHTFNEFTSGDHVQVTGEAGVFTFKSLRVDLAGNPLWVNVWGGPKGYEALRSFLPDRISPLKTIKRRGSKKR